MGAGVRDCSTFSATRLSVPPPLKLWWTRIRGFASPDFSGFALFDRYEWR